MKLDAHQKFGFDKKLNSKKKKKQLDLPSGFGTIHKKIYICIVISLQSNYKQK